MLKRCQTQLRVGVGGAYGLDFAAVLAMAEAMGATSPLLVDMLPEFERIIVAGLRPNDDGDGDALD